MKKEKVRTIYYSDPLNDDFAGTHIKQKQVDENYKYLHKNIFWRFFSNLIYYVFAIPIVWFYVKVIQNVKFKYEDKRSLKDLDKTYFLYGNHTGILDVYTPNLIPKHRRNKMVVSADAVSLKGVKSVVSMLGGIPVPNTKSGLRSFTEALEYYYNKKHIITIYPEAHIWPYYTGIRPFKDSSFGYPVKFNAPVVAFITAYTKPKTRLKKATRTIYISKPFFPNTELSFKEAKQDLRDRVYNWMKETAEKYSNYEYIKYVYKPLTEEEKAEQ